MDGTGPPLLIAIGTDSDDDLDQPGICSRHWRDLLTRHVTRIRFDARGIGVRDEYGPMFRHAIYQQHFPSQPPEFFAKLERGIFARIPQAANAAYPPMQFNEDVTAPAG